MQRVLFRCLAAVLFIWPIFSSISFAEKTSRPSAFVPDTHRVQELASLLSAQPVGVGRPISDRRAWQAVAKAPGFERVVSDAEKLLKQPVPKLTDDLYLDFSRTGNRTRCQRVLSLRQARVATLTLAECLENRGQFLMGIEEALRAICAEKTWVYPAHDRSLHNFHGDVTEIDLRVAGLSWLLATADYWLGDRLSPEMRQLLRSELERRTFRPFESMVNTGKPRLWWLSGTNNWNAVCLAGVTGSALAMIEPRSRRAFFVAAAEKAIRNFLAGFTPDGYCSEGIGYWNYGFGHFVMLTETVLQSTGGQVDLMTLDSKIESIAQFGRRMAILPHVYPAFADCHVGTRPSPEFMAWLSRRFGGGLQEFENQGLLLKTGPTTSLFQLGLMGFPNSASRRPAAEQTTRVLARRDWFPDAGVLICRPAPTSSSQFGIALKGGHNAEHHNHNDVGSFVVAVGGQTPLVDPGSEVYTARTFGSKRYDSGVLNSFGHPVPRVAGALQRSGRSAVAKVLQTDFRDSQDTIVLDLSAAYRVKELQELRRTFVFSREGNGSLTIIDEVTFASPESFGTALITFSPWRQLSPQRLTVGNRTDSVRVDIAADGVPFQMSAEPIEEDLPGGHHPTRIGINLIKPVSAARIMLTITPKIVKKGGREGVLSGQ